MVAETSKTRRIRKPKKPEDSWFYFMCEPDCADDCEEHCQTAKYMAESSDEERRRIDFYRNQLKWRVAECPVEYIIDFERSGLTFNLHNKDIQRIIINTIINNTQVT